jgi:hypothetical protein
MEYNETNLELISELIKKHLKPDLLPKKWQTKNFTNPTFGHCHNAAGCLYKIFGQDYIQMYRGLDDENFWHWWVIDINGKLIDLTSEQYTKFGRTPPYNNGIKAWPLGYDYKTRLMKLYDRVLNDYEKRNTLFDII